MRMALMTGPRLVAAGCLRTMFSRYARELHTSPFSARNFLSATRRCAQSPLSRLSVTRNFTSVNEKLDGVIPVSSPKTVEELMVFLRLSPPVVLRDRASDVDPSLLEAVYRVSAERVQELLTPPTVFFFTLKALARRSRECEGEDDNKIFAQALYEVLAKTLGDLQRTANRKMAEDVRAGLPEAVDRRWHEATVWVLFAASEHPSIDLHPLLDHYFLHYRRLEEELKPSSLCQLATALLRALETHGYARKQLLATLEAAYRCIDEFEINDVALLLSVAAMSGLRPPSSAITSVLGKFHGRLTELDNQKLQRLAEGLTFLKVRSIGKEMREQFTLRLSGLPFRCAHAILIYLSLCEQLDGDLLCLLQEENGLLSTDGLSKWPPHQLPSLLLLLCQKEVSGPVRKVAIDALSVMTVSMGQLSSANCIDAFYSVTKLRIKWSLVRSLILQLIEGAKAEQSSLKPEHISRMAAAIDELHRWRKPASREEVTSATKFFFRHPSGLGQIFFKASPESVGALCVRLMTLRLQHHALLEAIEQVVLKQLDSLAKYRPDVLVLVLRCFTKVGMRHRRFMVATTKSLVEANALEHINLTSRITLGWLLLANDITFANTAELIGRALLLDISQILSLKFSQLIELQEMNWLVKFHSELKHFKLGDEAQAMLTSQIRGTKRFTGALEIPSARQCVEELESMVGSDALLKNVTVYPDIHLHTAVLFDEDFQPVSWAETDLASVLNQPLLEFDGKLHCVAVFFLWGAQCVTVDATRITKREPGTVPADEPLPFCGEVQMIYKILVEHGWEPVFYRATDWLQQTDHMRALDSWKVMSELRRRGGLLDVTHASDALQADIDNNVDEVVKPAKRKKTEQNTEQNTEQKGSKTTRKTIRRTTHQT